MFIDGQEITMLFGVVKNNEGETAVVVKGSFTLNEGEKERAFRNLCKEWNITVVEISTFVDYFMNNYETYLEQLNREL